MNEFDLQRSAIKALARVLETIAQYSYASEKTLESGVFALEVLQWLEVRNVER